MILMLNKVKYMTIRDICVKDLIFYEDKDSKSLEEFCQVNFISYIPSKDRKKCYQYTCNGFLPLQRIPDEIKCQPSDLIFDEVTIQKFKTGNHDEVMFVMEDGLIKGVVHIVDYNNDDLYVELYRMFLNYENKLRKLLLNNSYSDEDLVKWFKDKATQSRKGKEKTYFQNRYITLNSDKERNKRLNSNPFQTFYLRDLINFGLSKRILIKKDFPINVISELRNWVAHSKDATSIHPNSEPPVYNIEGLLVFIGMTRTFFQSYDALEMLLD